MKKHTDRDAIRLVNAADPKMRELYRSNKQVSPDATFAGLILYSEDLGLQKRFEIPAGTNSIVLCLPVVMSTRLFVFRKPWNEWLARVGVDE